MTTRFVEPTSIRDAGAAVLYGAGSVGRDVCGLLARDGIRVLGLIDQKANNGDVFDGVPIWRLDECPLDSGTRASTPLVLTIFNRATDIVQLAAIAERAGFRKIISFIDLHAAHPQALGDRYWLTGREFLDGESTAIARADSLWADEKSRVTYRRLLDLRRTGTFAAEVRPKGSVQYLPEDVPDWLPSHPVRLVDCGAFDGDTLDVFTRSGLRIEASAHFEPDLENFATLTNAARARACHGSGPFSLWPCAVSDRSGPVTFESGRGEASSLSGPGNTSATAVALDDVLVGWHPTLIKMDIEGAELAALSGARSLITSDLPRLAICVYHRPGDLWRIPELICAWPEMAGYRHYLRVHAFMGFDTVMYSVPPDVSSTRRSGERS